MMKFPVAIRPPATEVVRSIGMAIVKYHIEAVRTAVLVFSEGFAGLVVATIEG